MTPEIELIDEPMPARLLERQSEPDSASEQAIRLFEMLLAQLKAAEAGPPPQADIRHPGDSADQEVAKVPRPSRPPPAPPAAPHPPRPAADPRPAGSVGSVPSLLLSPNAPGSTAQLLSALETVERLRSQASVTTPRTDSMPPRARPIAATDRSSSRSLMQSSTSLTRSLGSSPVRRVPSRQSFAAMAPQPGSGSLSSHGSPVPCRRVPASPYANADSPTAERIATAAIRRKREAHTASRGAAPSGSYSPRPPASHAPAVLTSRFSPRQQPSPTTKASMVFKPHLRLPSAAVAIRASAAAEESESALRNDVHLLERRARRLKRQLLQARR